MAIKRRSFLGLLGGAVAAPVLPTPAFAKATPAVLSKSAVHAAIYHAQSRAVFSVWGLAKAANLSLEQATAVMEHLADRGILGPLQGTTHGGRWASSKVLQSEMLAKARAAKAAQRLKDITRPKTAPVPFHCDLTYFVESVKTIAARYESQRPVLPSMPSA
ncbi:MAG: hypothetical protein AAFQ64_13925 [Pseudomonadota bacterium]